MRDGVWSHATQGFLNFRDGQDNDPRQHVRAHGNEQPFAPLRELVASARMHVEARAPVRDVLPLPKLPQYEAMADHDVAQWLARLGFDCEADDSVFYGGEQAALERLEVLHKKRHGSMCARGFRIEWARDVQADARRFCRRVLQFQVLHFSLLAGAQLCAAVG